MLIGVLLPASRRSRRPVSGIPNEATTMMSAIAQHRHQQTDIHVYGVSMRIMYTDTMLLCRSVSTCIIGLGRCGERERKGRHRGAGIAGQLRGRLATPRRHKPSRSQGPIALHSRGLERLVIRSLI